MTAERPDPAESAAEAGLRYVSDEQPGIRRKPSGRGFAYVAPDGAAVRDPHTLLRIRHLVIPPAWTNVWICPSPNGHIQATGRDARGRKQYRYHARWTEVRDTAKYERLQAFAEALPHIRAATERDLRQPGVPRTKVLAAVVRLLEETSIRIGNEEYRRENSSFGLTTMRDRHAEFEGSTLRFRFKGKGGKEHIVELHDRRLAPIVRQCQDIPGQELFQYLDEDGQRHAIESSDVNAYLRVCPQSGSPTAGKRQVTAAIKNVAAELGNTPAVCRRAYVHPVVVNAYFEGSLQPEAGVRVQGELSEEEECVLKLLKVAAERATRAAA